MFGIRICWKIFIRGFEYLSLPTEFTKDPFCFDTGSFQKLVELISIDRQGLEVELLVQQSGNLTKEIC